MKTIKRSVSILIMVEILIITLSITSSATSSSGYFKYTVTNGKAQITGYTRNSGAVTIPSTLDGYTVTSIGSCAFYFCGRLTSISIPSTVTSINTLAFLIVTDFIVDADNTAYASLDGVLYNKTKTELIRCPGGVTSFVIPQGVTSIGEYAFNSCANLTSIRIPQGVTSIGEEAFCGCSELTSLIIPSTVTSVGGAAFVECWGLNSIEFDSAKTKIISYDARSPHPEIMGTTIIGYDPSTAKDYANKFGLPFVAISAGQTAIPTKSAVLVNGSNVAFQAYNIDGNNYFKLRDMAKVLSGTAKQVEVCWDAANNVIDLTTGKAYTSVGGELAVSGDTANKVATLTTSKVYLNCSVITVTAYNIGGNNYFKLRDVAAAINFGVTWNGTTSTIVIDTSTGYMA